MRNAGNQARERERERESTDLPFSCAAAAAFRLFHAYDVTAGHVIGLELLWPAAPAVWLAELEL